MKRMTVLSKIGLGLTAITIFVCAIFGMILALRVERDMVAGRATEFVGTLHTGEHIILACDYDRILILPVDTSPIEIGILQGSYTSVTNDIDRHEYHPVDGKPTMFLIGCLKVEVIKDPDSNWMLNIYKPPAK